MAHEANWKLSKLGRVVLKELELVRCHEVLEFCLVELEAAKKLVT